MAFFNISLETKVFPMFSLGIKVSPGCHWGLKPFTGVLWGLKTSQAFTVIWGFTPCSQWVLKSCPGYPWSLRYYSEFHWILKYFPKLWPVSLGLKAFSTFSQGPIIFYRFSLGLRPSPGSCCEIILSLKSLWSLMPSPDSQWSLEPSTGSHFGLMPSEGFDCVIRPSPKFPEALGCI